MTVKSQKKDKSLNTQPAETDVYQNTLKAAAKLFRKQGYAATTLRQIADVLGIQAGSFYYHFKSKEEILDKVLDTGIRMVLEEVQKRVEMLPPDASSRDRIAAAIEGHLSGLLQYGDFTSANIRSYGQIPEGPRKRNQPIRAVYAAYWDELFDDALRKGEIRSDVPAHLLRLFVIGSLNWTGEWFDPQRGPVEDLIRQISSVVFGGIIPQEDVRLRAARSQRRGTKARD